MKRIVSKVIDVTPMPQVKAEQLIGPIPNILYGNDGYLIGNRWMPKEQMEAQSLSYNTEVEVLESFTIDANRHMEWLENEFLSNHQSSQAKKIIQMLKNYKAEVHLLKRIIKGYEKD